MLNRNIAIADHVLKVNGNGIFIDQFTFKNYIIRRFYHRRLLGSHNLIRYILYLRNELQEYANWHPNTLKYIKRLHFSTVASPATARITYISIRHILFFLHELQKLSKWHPITMTYIKKLHYSTVTSPATARIAHFDPVHTIFLSFTLVETKIIAGETPNPFFFCIPNISLFYFTSYFPA